MSMQTAIEPVRRSVTVRRPPDDAFGLFTDGIGTWWPFESHSIGEDKVETAVFEPLVGGELYEQRRDGTRCHWATVLAWDPPSRIVLEWKVNPNAVAATELEIRFTAEGDVTRASTSSIAGGSGSARRRRKLARATATAGRSCSAATKRRPSPVRRDGPRAPRGPSRARSLRRCGRRRS
jgi:uncharacterized protein YndB with AHSA1/START domain